MPLGAAVGLGALNIGAKVIGANEARDARKDASRDANRRLDETKAAAQPFMDFGLQGLEALSDPNAMRESFETSPGYQFRMNEGLNAVNTNKAVQGLLRSGSSIKDVVRFSQGVASDEWGRHVNDQRYKVGVGQQAGNQIAGVNSAQAQNDLYRGEARAAGSTDMANSVMSGVNTGLNIYDKFGGS